MLPDIWINFSLVVLIQFSFFFITALYYKKLKEVPLILLYGFIIGTIVGLLYDLALGKYLGLFSYSFGFEIPYLLLNASISYGLFVASVLLLQTIRTLHFTIWLSALVIVYEITNLYFPVWTYGFTLPLIPFFIICLIGYSSGAVLASTIAYLIYKHPFALRLVARKR